LLPPAGTYCSGFDFTVTPNLPVANLHERNPNEVPDSLRELAQDRAEILVLEYATLSLVKALIEALADDDDAIVDNNNGVTLRGDRFG
jgi:hypothetical protein